MLLSHFIVSIFSVGVMVLGEGVASGQDYANKSIRIVTPGAGGGGDFIASIIAQRISGPLSQSVMVENRLTLVADIKQWSQHPLGKHTLRLHWAQRFHGEDFRLYARVPSAGELQRMARPYLSGSLLTA